MSANLPLSVLMNQVVTVRSAWIGPGLHKRLITHSFRASRRAGKVLEGQFGDALKKITAVTDRHAAYFALEFKDHQICLSHILRELQYLNELDSNQNWASNVQKLLKEAIHERIQNPSTQMDPSP